jgi:3-deoxy-D-manno-octulosonic acid kinase
MMNGRRVATARGAVLADAAHVEAVGESRDMESLFEPLSWADRSAITPVIGGRGAAWFIERGSEQWVLRHYRRGGWMARATEDRYLWTGEDAVRAFAEYRLLETLVAEGMPVPVPVAARYERRGFWYRCDLITRRIPGAISLTAVLADNPLPQPSWAVVGATIARLHGAGVDHADLNAHNILIDSWGAVSVIDFDRGRIRGAGPWAGRNLRRLRRSLHKISAGLPAGRFSGDSWQSLMSGYLGERR